MESIKARSPLYHSSLLLLIGTTLIWGTTFPLIKEAVASLSASTLIAVRFAIAAIAVLPFCRRLNSKLICNGLLLGVVLFAAYLTQVVGLESTTANRSAFITSLHVIVVPFLGILWGQTVPSKIFVAAGLAIAGVGVLSWEGGSFVIGDLWTLGCALTYAIYIVLMETIAPQHNALRLTSVQLITVALLSLLWAMPDLAAQAPLVKENFGAIAYLGLIATAATTWTQAIAQRNISATKTAIVYTLEPVFAAVFSFWWLGERLGIRGMIGAGTIFAAMLLSQIQIKSSD